MNRTIDSFVQDKLKKVVSYALENRSILWGTEYYDTRKEAEERILFWKKHMKRIYKQDHELDVFEILEVTHNAYYR
jgi:hypothetical protein